MKYPPRHYRLLHPHRGLLRQTRLHHRQTRNLALTLYWGHHYFLAQGMMVRHYLQPMMPQECFQCLLL
jgi:hypothetical protein